HSLDSCLAVSCIEGFCNASEARCLTSTVLMASQKPHRSANGGNHRIAPWGQSIDVRVWVIRALEPTSPHDRVCPQPDAQPTATRSLVGAGCPNTDPVDVDLGHSSVSITRTRIWRKILEFIRLPLPLLPVARGRFFYRNIWPDFRVFRIQ